MDSKRLEEIIEAAKVCHSDATCEQCTLNGKDCECVGTFCAAIVELAEENERLKRHNAFLTRFNEDVLNGNIKDGKVRLVLEVKEANEREHGS